MINQLQRCVAMLISFVALSASSALGQTTLTEKDALNSFGSVLFSYCRAFSVGSYIFDESQVTWLRELQLANIIELRNLRQERLDQQMNWDDFQKNLIGGEYELSISLHPTMAENLLIRNNETSYCAPLGDSDATDVRVVSLDAINRQGQDGVVWNAYVVQYAYSRKFSEPERRIMEARHGKQFLDGSYKSRALFKWDAFKNEWKYTVSDWGMLDDNYLTSKVPANISEN